MNQCDAEAAKNGVFVFRNAYEVGQLQRYIVLLIPNKPSDEQ